MKESHTLKYTLCFIRHGLSCLMLNRTFAPNMGLWNGVGGKIEPGESPEAGVLREVDEETGLPVCNLRFSGVVTWQTTSGEFLGGMYVYLADLDGDWGGGDGGNWGGVSAGGHHAERASHRGQEADGTSGMPHNVVGAHADAAPIATKEGILAWKSLDWILHPDNLGVVSNIPTFLPEMLRGEDPIRHAFTYEDDRIVAYDREAL